MSTLPQTSGSNSPPDSRAPGMDEDEHSLLREFISEAIEHVDSVEAAALRLESSPGDSSSVNTIFRGFHTIKGGAGFLSFPQIGLLAHAAEGVLEVARQGRLTLHGPTMDLVLEAADRVRSMVKALDPHESNGVNDVATDEAWLSDLVERLERCARLEPSTFSESAPNAAELEVADRATPDTRRPPTSEEPLPITLDPASGGVDAVVKITTERLDALINLVGELVVAELMVRDSVSEMHGVRADGGDDVDAMSAAEARAPRHLADLGRITRELYDLSVSMRMVPIHSTFQKMARAARDLGRKTGKELELQVRGGETELDRKLVESIADPLMHMVRNAIDHGIEPPDDRATAGKPRGGPDLRGAARRGRDRDRGER